MNTNQKLVLFGGGALVAATFCPNMYCVGFFVVVAVFVAVTDASAARTSRAARSASAARSL